MRNERNLPAEKINAPKVDPCFKPITRYWWWIQWDEVITKHYPILKLKFDDTENDWALLHAIKALAQETGIDFEDAASWVLQRALAMQVANARKMAKGDIPWDTKILHLCRVMSLVLCKFYDPDLLHTMRTVDRMIWTLLITEEELLANATPANRMSC